MYFSKISSSYINFANSIPFEPNRHIRMELGQGFYRMVLTDAVNQTFPDQPEHATDRKYFHFKKCF